MYYVKISFFEREWEQDHKFLYFANYYDAFKAFLEFNKDSENTRDNEYFTTASLPKEVNKNTIID
jgi:hypothetical protein